MLPSLPCPNPDLDGQVFRFEPGVEYDLAGSPVSVERRGFYRVQWVPGGLGAWTLRGPYRTYLAARNYSALA